MISAIIITKNEAKDIGACLASVSWMDEIVVVDCGSTDGTQEICRQSGAILIETDWPGYGLQKQRALEQASCEWVFSIDADERISEELKAEIKRIIDKGSDYSAYRTPILNFFNDRPVTHSFKPTSGRHIRLFKRKMCEFTNDIVHENVIAKGKVGMLKNNLLHYSFHNLEELLTKVNSYSSLAAQKLAAKNKKSSILKALARASWAFMKFYVIKGGLLDGWNGFIISFSNFEQTFYRYAKLLELQKKK